MQERDREREREREREETRVSERKRIIMHANVKLSATHNFYLLHSNNDNDNKTKILLTALQYPTQSLHAH